MKRISLLIAAGFLCATICFGKQSADLLSARHAQALLGDEVWSQVVRIENTGATDHYPRIVHALVFELVGRLWFYTDSEGTQGFSMYRGRLAQDKANFGPLMHEIHPGFTRWTIVRAERLADLESKPLSNGCFIESVANLRRCLLSGEVIMHPQLLSYYAKSRHTGHTVLTYETVDGVRVIDPACPTASLVFPRELASNARSLGAALIGPLVDEAVWVSVGDFAASLVKRCTGT